VRIVSVLPSATEIVCALGARRELVGRSAECDYPSDVREVPVVMRPRTLDADRPSAEIDRRVQAARANGESLYELDVELLRALRPDVLLTQDLCGVCSVTGEEVAVACASAGVRPAVVSLSPRTLEEVWRTFTTVGEAIGRPREARELVERSRSRPEGTGSPGRFRVAVVEWLDPPILAGLWTPDIVRAAGGTPVGPASGDVGSRTGWTELATVRPELVVLSPCSFSAGRTEQELLDPTLAAGVRAVAPRLGTFVADEAYFSRPGPRLSEGVRLVRALLGGSLPPSSMPVRRWTPAPEEAAA
jgi:iron complex transport system substrate-binding protein